MARREVVEIQCDRCERRETQNKTEVWDSKDGEPECRIRLGQTAIDFPDLCRRCRETVRNYIDRIRKAKLDDETNNGTKELPKPKSGGDYLKKVQ